MLIVDDEAIICMQLQERLSVLGYEIVGTAFTGPDGVAMAREKGPDIVLMDILMQGEMAGITAAAEIQSQLNIPIIFITAYAEDAIIHRARSVSPYGYLVKPFAENAVKAAIEMALARYHSETTGRTPRRGNQFFCINGENPDNQAVLLDGFFSDITLFIYSPEAEKTPLFRQSLDHGIKNNEYTIYAYYRSCIGESFRRHVHEGNLQLFKIQKEGVNMFIPYMESCCKDMLESRLFFAIRFLIDFSKNEDFESMLAIKNWILAKRDSGFPISGVLSFSLDTLDEEKISILSQGIPRVVVASGLETTLSFADSFCAEGSLRVVPRQMLEESIKKTLEPIVLSLVLKQMSGFEILREINNQYNIIIPQSRIYGLLYDLESRGIVHSETRGKAKIYHPTEEGQMYIKERLKEFQSVYSHILGGMNL